MNRKEFEEQRQEVVKKAQVYAAQVMRELDVKELDAAEVVQEAIEVPHVSWTQG